MLLLAGGGARPGGVGEYGYDEQASECVGERGPRLARVLVDGFRHYVSAMLDQFARHETNTPPCERFLDRVSFVAATSEDPNALLEAVDAAERALGGPVRRLLYPRFRRRRWRRSSRWQGAAG